MSLDILLLVGTIVVAVGAVIVGLLRAVLERRRAPSLWAQYRSRRIEPERLARAVPGPTAADGSIRQLERQAPAIGSRPAFAALGVPVVTEPVPVMSEPAVVLPEPVPLIPAAILAAPEPLVEAPEAVVATPEPTVADPEPVIVATEPVIAEPEPAVPGPRSRPTAPEFAWVTPALEVATTEPVPAVPEDAAADVAGAGTEAEPELDMATSAPEPEPESVVAVPGPVPLYLPGTYPVAEADLTTEEGSGDVVPMSATAPAARATAAMVAGYAPVARAIVRPPEPDGIEDELAYRIGIPGAKRPERPAVIEVAGGEEVIVPILPTVETEAWPERRGRARRRAAIGMTALVGATALAIAVAVLVPSLTPQGAVLTATGTPQTSDDGGVAAPETPTPAPPAASAVPPASTAPEATLSPALSASPSPTPSSASTDQVKTATVTPRPEAPTAKPTFKPTAKPTPKPFASFDCTSDGLTLSCDGSGSRFAESYLWYFGEGPTQTGAQASHTYATPVSYLVTLIVTNASGSDRDSRQYSVP